MQWSATYNFQLQLSTFTFNFLYFISEGPETHEDKYIAQVWHQMNKKVMLKYIHVVSL